MGDSGGDWAAGRWGRRGWIWTRRMMGVNWRYPIQEETVITSVRDVETDKRE